MISKSLRIGLASLVLIVALIWQPGLTGHAGGGAVLSVVLSHVRIHRSSLSFDWRLANGSDGPIYVYSTFLEGPAALTPSKQAGILKIRTSLSAPAPAGVNAYPPAKFLRIEPGRVATGKFIESKLSRNKLDGVGAVEMEVGYGTQIEELKRQIQATSRNGEHPANPVVAWQAVAAGEAKVEK